MKRFFIAFVLLISSSFCAFAQNYGFVDSDYVSQNIPEYVAAQAQLDQLSEKFGQEVAELYSEVDNMYDQYQKEAATLSQSQREQLQSNIIAKEQEMQELQNKYFGVDGELYKQTELLLNPINEKIINAIKDIAIQDNLIAVFDSSVGDNLIYANPNYDISDKVLEKLGININN